MEIFERLAAMSAAAAASEQTDPFVLIHEELQQGLSRYRHLAAQVLNGSGINLLDPGPAYFSLESNFFSALFLYSYYRAGIPGERRALYAAVNQCLRGMVTGCDNILDDEYKATLESDLPAGAVRFRSIIDIMVSDRVLFELLLDRGLGLSRRQALQASAATLRALCPSGVEEASEEGGISLILKPQEVLDSVSHRKTGVLFKCPWALPLIIEEPAPEVVTPLLNALYHIGMGCQVMDDMVDLATDLQERRHNYLVALIHHGPDDQESSHLRRLADEPAATRDTAYLQQHFPRALSRAADQAWDFLQAGLGTLYAKQHQDLLAPTINFLARRIGAEPFLDSQGP